MHPCAVTVAMIYATMELKINMLSLHKLKKSW